MNSLSSKAQIFSNACVEMNSALELKEILASKDVSCDTEVWGISESEAIEAIEDAIQELEDFGVFSWG